MNYKLKTRMRYHVLTTRFYTKLVFLAILLFSLMPSVLASQTPFTLTVKDKTLKEVFKEIEANSEYLIFYFEDVLDANRKVSISVKDQSINQLLDKVLKDTECVYKIEDKQIYIAKEERQLTTPPQVVQGRLPIKGKVIDIKGIGVPGVTILVVGSSRGVVTDVDGTFSIDVLDIDKLQFSFIGLETQTLPVKKEMLVVMEEISDILDEAVVVAFSTQKKESIVSAITTINPSELKIPSSNLTQSFAGRISGLIAYQRSGEPGQDNAEFFIRGVTTFGTGKANPLILIDDVELTTSDLSRLHPDDIASFSILKDASATALYGARGANGVILVKTKEGKEGKVSLNFRYENSISAPISDTKVVDPLTFMKLHNEAVSTRDPLIRTPYMDSEIDARERGLNPAVYPIVDWHDMLFKDFTMNQRANLNINGGGKLARYYVALSYAHDSGMFKTNSSNNFDNNISLSKYSIRSNINLNLGKTTDLAVRMTGTFDDYQGPLDGGARMYEYAVKSNPVLFPATYAPDAVNVHTNHILFGNSGLSGDYMNPYAQMLKGYKESENTVIIAQLELKQDLSMITEGLRARVLGSTTRNSSFDITRQYKPFWYNIGYYDKMNDEYMLYALNPDGDKGGTDYLDYTSGGKSVSTAIYFETSLVYERVFAEKHAVSGLLVWTARESKNGNESTLIKSLPGRNLGLAGRFSYGYNDRYYAEANFGYNGSERFDKNSRWGFFPSAGLGWIMSKENFWQSSSFLAETFQTFKLKASYGVVGNDNISDQRFFYISEVNLNNSDYGFNFGEDNFSKKTNGISVGRYADDQIGWEISKKLNLGLEMKIFSDLDIQIDYFRETRTNILQERTDIPSLLGLNANPFANIGEANGSGIDMSVNYQKYFNEDLWLTVMGNFTYATSEFTIYEEPEYLNTPWRSKVGHNLKQEWGFIAERLFVDEADVDNSPKQMFGEYMAGDIKYQDINNDGVVNDQDMVPIGHPTTPEIIYGFGFSAGYKDFDFSCFFQGSARSSFWIDPKAVAPFKHGLNPDHTPLKGNNGVLEFIADNHWSEDNNNVYAAWPRLSNYEIENNTKRSTWFMNNGNFLRLKSAEIGYTLPEILSNDLRIEKLRIYLSGTNLFSLNSFKHWDPEMGGNGFGYPLQRVFNVGIQVNF